MGVASERSDCAIAGVCVHHCDVHGCPECAGYEMSKIPYVCNAPIFKRWSWWSMWADVCVFDFADRGYALQASRSRTGKLRFRSVAMGSSVYNCRSHAITSLKHGLDE